MRHRNLILSATFAVVAPLAAGLLADNRRVVAATADTRPATRPDVRIEATNVSRLAFSRDGRLLLVTDEETATVWDLASWKKAAGPIPYESAVAMTADAASMATGGTDRHARATVQVWDARTGEPTTLVHVGPPIRDMAFTPDGTRLVVSSPSADARIWDVRTGRRTTTLAGLRGGRSVHFDPTGRFLLSIDNPETASLWDATTGERTAGPLRCTADIGSAAFNPTGDRLALADGDDVRLVDVPTGRERSVIRTGRPVSDVDFHPDGLRLLVGCYSGARVFDTTTGRPAGPRVGSKSFVLYARFDSMGQRVAVAGQADESGLWDWRTGRQVLRLDGIYWDVPPVVTESPDGRALAVHDPLEKVVSLVPIPKP